MEGRICNALCNDGCCNIYFRSFEKTHKIENENNSDEDEMENIHSPSHLHYSPHYSKSSKRRKAGVVIHDSKTNRVLLVQSKNNFWGVPKGGTNYNEKVDDCAIREVFEETGILLEKEMLNQYFVVGKQIYYYVDMNYCDVEIQYNKNTEANDVYGICWYKIECLSSLVENREICLTTTCKHLLKRFIGISL